MRSQFDGLLVSRRKLYPAELRGVLAINADRRAGADYGEVPIAEAEASRAGRRSHMFVEAIRSIGFGQ